MATIQFAMRKMQTASIVMFKFDFVEIGRKSYATWVNDINSN